MDTLQQITNLLEKTNKTLERFKDIPFGNSIVQNIHLITNDQYSLARKYRALGLRLQDRKIALEETIFELRKKYIQLKKLHQKLENEKDELEKEMIQIEIEQTLNSLSYIEKLCNDCSIEIKTLCALIEQFPEIDRKEFELQEFEHFKNKIINSLIKKPDEISTLEALQFKVELNGEQLQITDNNNTNKIIEFIETLKEDK